MHDDIIENIPENTPTEWVSPVVIVPKQNNNIRLWQTQPSNAQVIQYQLFNLSPWN
jgi:hypothetical protein